MFHYPLLYLAHKYGLSGFVAGKLNLDDIINQVAQNRFVLLSIDLQKISNKLSGSHLILVHGYCLRKKYFIVHDSAHVVAENGENAKLSTEILQRISNNKGIVMGR